MEKINKVVKLEDLPRKGVKALLKKYPEGWKDFVRKITKPSGEFFYAINIDTDSVSYLVKIDVKIDSQVSIEQLEEEFGDKSAEAEAKNDSDKEGVLADPEDDD